MKVIAQSSIDLFHIITKHKIGVFGTVQETKEKEAWLNQFIPKLVTRTKLVNKNNDQHYIRYLTNYAFMYKQLTIINLKQSPYANVRRELK